MGVPAFGTSLTNSSLYILLQEQLSGMGDYLTQTVGSLAWSEANTFAVAMDTANNYIQMMANQLTPAEASAILSVWKQIYNINTLSDQDAKTLIELKQSQFGTIPNLSNLMTYLSNQLGKIFIDVEWAPELQSKAIIDPQTILNGGTYISPLSLTYVYIWQPRDNQDNLLMPDNIFVPLENSYLNYVDSWSPAFDSFITLNLTNRGNQDGYGGGYNGMNYNNYLDGYNVVSGNVGSTTITGIDTTFLTYPNGDAGDFASSVIEGFYPPIQIVDDSEILQTYFVNKVLSNAQLNITVPLANNITLRTYRCLGIVCDTDGELDGGSLFSS